MTPLNFVIPEKYIWPEIKDNRIDDIDDEKIAQRGISAINCWIIIPFIYFLRYGFQVTYSTVPVKNKINIASGLDLGMRDRGFYAFVVACRSDGHFPMLANYVFEQNGLFPKKNVSHIFHPPQPNIIKRDSEREYLIESITYKGDILNLHESFRSQDFLDRLSSIGIKCIFDFARYDGSKQKLNDYHNCDLTLAVRNTTIIDTMTKPASKLINSWLAECPALLGPEPPYRELRRTSLDYFEVANPKDVLETISKLRQNPQIYQGMLINCNERSKEYTIEAMIKTWIDTIDNKVQPEFERWKSKSDIIKICNLVIKYFLEKRSKQIAKYHRTHGPRILDSVKN